MCALRAGEKIKSENANAFSTISPEREVQPKLPVSPLTKTTERTPPTMLTDIFEVLSTASDELKSGADIA